MAQFISPDIQISATEIGIGEEIIITDNNNSGEDFYVAINGEWDMTAYGMKKRYNVPFSKVFDTSGIYELTVQGTTTNAPKTFTITVKSESQQLGGGHYAIR